MSSDSQETWLIDTNVLVYFLNSQSNLHALTTKTLEEFENQGARLVVAQQNLLELTHVLREGYGLKQEVVLTKINNLTSKRLQIIVPQQKTWEGLQQLLKQATSKNKPDIFDLFLQATAMDNGVCGILTADKSGFINLPDFKVRILARK